MDITHMTYALVREGIRVPDPQLQPIDPVLRFLSAHITKLLEAEARTDSPPPGFFHSTERQSDFRHLHSGTDEEFLASYRVLAQELVNVMNRSTKEGLLVGIRAVTESYGVVAGVLKLQIVVPNGAALLTNEDGTVVRLEAIQDLVNEPGNLQKGALVTSHLPEERVHCRDTSNTTAKYFPAAFGIKVHPRPREAMAALFDAAWQVVPQATAQIAEAVQTCSAGTVHEVLAEVATKVPDLTEAVQAEIVERLSVLPLPVIELDPKRIVKGAYKVGEILISGPLAAIEGDVTVDLLPDGRWRLTLYSDSKPSFTRT